MPADALSDKLPEAVWRTHGCKFAWWKDEHAPKVLGRSSDRLLDPKDESQKNVSTYEAKFLF